jgi:hypothetical protein
MHQTSLRIQLAAYPAVNFIHYKLSECVDLVKEVQQPIAEHATTVIGFSS